jgi:hypothetical protein
VNSKNALKRTYMHLQFQNFFWGLYPGPSLKREGMGQVWGGREGGRSCVPNDFSFRCAAPDHHDKVPNASNSRHYLRCIQTRLRTTSYFKLSIHTARDAVQRRTAYDAEIKTVLIRKTSSVHYLTQHDGVCRTTSQ